MRSFILVLLFSSSLFFLSCKQAEELDNVAVVQKSGEESSGVELSEVESCDGVECRCGSECKCDASANCGSLGCENAREMMPGTIATAAH